jgi:replicative DNA helicase
MNDLLNLPASVESERALLGAILLSNGELYPSVAAVLSEDEFFLPTHRAIFRAMGQMKGPIDLVTLTVALGNAKELDAVGGPTYISGLTDGFPRLDNVDAYIEIVKAKADLRKLAHVGNAATQRAISGEEAPGDIGAELQRTLSEITSGAGKGFQHFAEIFEQRYKSIDAVADSTAAARGAQTGFRELDSMTGGLHAGELFILAGRPGMGKTTLALNIATKISFQKTVGIFSLEMSRDALVLRMLCSEGKVDSHKLMAGAVGREDRVRLAGAFGVLATRNLYIDDDSQLRPETMLARAKRLAGTRELGLVVIDYLQLINAGRYKESRVQEVSYISRMLKQAAKEINCPVLAVCQLNRAPEERDGEPRLSDLRDSGQIEQDADTVVFLWKEANAKMHHSRQPEESPKPDNTLDVSVKKQRNGPTGHFKLAFLRQYSRFENLLRDDEQQQRGFYEQGRGDDHNGN